MTAEGLWVQDREFGLQFRADMPNSTPPTTSEGIEKYPDRVSGPHVSRPNAVSRWFVDRLGSLNGMISTHADRLA